MFIQFQVPTLGSQEGAFENVRMTFSGEQGQTIRQLIGAHVLRRVAMCCLASPKGRRQHLAVSHEKGKVLLMFVAHSLNLENGEICNNHVMTLWMTFATFHYRYLN